MIVSMASMIPVPALVAAAEAVDHQASEVLVEFMDRNPVALVDALSDEFAAASAIDAASREQRLEIVESEAAVVFATLLGTLVNVTDRTFLLAVLRLDIELVAAG
jgi:hypothetical protein